MLKLHPNELFAEIIGELQLYSLVEPSYEYNRLIAEGLENIPEEETKKLLKNKEAKKISNKLKAKVKRLKEKKEYDEPKIQSLLDELWSYSSDYLLSPSLSKVLKEELINLINSYNLIYEQCIKLEDSELHSVRAAILSIICFFRMKNTLSKLGKEYKNSQMMVTDNNFILSGLIISDTIKDFIDRDSSLISREKNPNKYPLIKTSTIFHYKVETHIYSGEENFLDKHQEVIDYIFLARINWLIKDKIFKGTPYYYLLDPKELFINLMNKYTFRELYNQIRSNGIFCLLSHENYFDDTSILRPKEYLIEKNLKFLILWTKIIKRKFSEMILWLEMGILAIEFLRGVDFIPKKIRGILDDICDEENELSNIEKILKELLNNFYSNNSYGDEITNFLTQITSPTGLTIINLALKLGERFFKESNSREEDGTRQIAYKL